MAAKQRKAPSKTQNKKNNKKTVGKVEKRSKEEETSELPSSNQQPARSWSTLTMVSFVAVAVAGMYVANNRHFPFLSSPGYNVEDSYSASTPLQPPPIEDSTATPLEPPHTVQTVYDQKWGNFNGIATMTKAYNVLKIVAHDPDAFTQGLQVHKDQMIESTGGYGDSLVRMYDPHTGHVSKETNKLPKNYFGEGVTYFQDEEGNERFLWLTWREATAFVLDMDLNIVNMFQFVTQTDEGWGITFDPIQKVFFVTDGSPYLQVWDLNFKEIRRVEVSYQTNPEEQKRTEVPQVNELEWDPTDGTILANLWYQNAIIRVDPHHGQVLQVYDLTDLYVNRHETADCMNGIAHQGGNRWWLTGKLWPHMYLVEFLE